MRSKLEPGCRAIVIKSVSTENIGKIVKCIKFIGIAKTPLDNIPFVNKDMWEVDAMICFTDKKHFNKTYHNICSGSVLQRIDDHPDNMGILENAILEAEKNY